MKIIFEDAVDGNKIVHAKISDGFIDILIEDYEEPIRNQDIALDYYELQLFIQRLQDLSNQLKCPK